MIKISNCPDSGLTRKVTKQLQKLETVQQVILECVVHYFRADDTEINKRGIHPYPHKLVATNQIYVNPFSVGADAGKKWSKEQSAAYDSVILERSTYPARLAEYEKNLAAYNLLENPAFGPPIAPAVPPADPALKPMGQFDFFMQLSKMPVNIDELEVKEIMEADAAGKFNT